MFHAPIPAWSGRLEESRGLLETNRESEPRGSFGRFSLMLRKAIEGIEGILSGGFREHMIRDTQFQRTLDRVKSEWENTLA